MDGRVVVTEAEILEAIRQAIETKSQEGPVGATLQEIREVMQFPNTRGGEVRARAEVKRLLRDGTMEAVRVRRASMDGRMMLVPGYRLK